MLESTDIVPFLLGNEAAVLVVHSEKSILLPALSDGWKIKEKKKDSEMKFLQLFKFE